MSGYLSVTNWHDYQHYKDRTPIWIKFYVDSVHNEKLKKLPIPTRLLWDQMLLLAASFQNSVPNSPELVANLTGIPCEQCAEGIELLLKGRWLREKQTRRSASKPASLEKEEKRVRRESARARALLESAEKFVLASAHFDDDDRLRSRLVSEYQIVDDVTVRRLLAVAAEARAA